jgi:hypothetical protein
MPTIHLVAISFVKKHYEKLILTAVLVVLIVAVASFALKLGALAKGFDEPERRVHKGKPVASMDMAGYSNTIARLNNPFVWAALERDPFRPVERVEEVPVTTEEPTVARKPRLVRVVREPFKLLFKQYSYDAETQQGYNFQINFRDFRKTFFVRAVGDPVKDPWENTGYKITKFVRKTTMVRHERIGGETEKDISELTLEHESEKPILLIWGQEAEQQEPVGWVDCLGQTHYLRRDQRFRCGGTVYKVVDITPSQMIIIDEQSGEEHLLRLGPSER